MLGDQIVKGVNLGVELCEVQPTTVSAAFADRGGLAHCHRFVESDGVVVTDLLRVDSVDVTLSGTAQRTRAAARSEMRAHSGDSALEIVARLIESEIANKNTRIMSMIP